MARFVIADISGAKAVLQELHRVLPACSGLLAAVRLEVGIGAVRQILPPRSLEGRARLVEGHRDALHTSVFAGSKIERTKIPGREKSIAPSMSLVVLESVIPLICPCPWAVASHDQRLKSNTTAPLLLWRRVGPIPIGEKLETSRNKISRSHLTL
jgi:hypothetical protein